MKSDQGKQFLQRTFNYLVDCFDLKKMFTFAIFDLLQPCFRIDSQNGLDRIGDKEFNSCKVESDAAKLNLKAENRRSGTTIGFASQPAADGYT
jgi:hypothetical protein